MKYLNTGKCFVTRFFTASDMCETAAQVFKCEVENDPKVASDMVWARGGTGLAESQVDCV